METVNKGRKMVIGLIVIILAIDIITIVSVSSIYYVRGKVDLASFKLLQGIFRFILTGLLMFFLYKGHRWAKWLSVGLFLLAGFSSIVSSISSFDIITVAMGLIYIFFGVTLIASVSINNFFRLQREIFNTSDLAEDTCIDVVANAFWPRLCNIP